MNGPSCSQAQVDMIVKMMGRVHYQVKAMDWQYVDVFEASAIIEDLKALMEKTRKVL